MSTSDGMGARRPLRLAGYALLGLAVVAALVGMLVVFTGGEPDLADGRPTAGSVPGGESATPSAAQTPSASSGTPAPPSGATTAPNPAGPPPAGPPPAGPPPAGPPPAGPGPAHPNPAGPAPAPARPGAGPAGPGAVGPVAAHQQSRGELRVYNNSTIQGLAARAADDLTAAGWMVVDVGNYPGGRIWTTTVYYQNSGDQRAIAEEIGAKFGMRVEPRFAGIEDATPGLIVIVTNDYGT